MIEERALREVLGTEFDKTSANCQLQADEWNLS